MPGEASPSDSTASFPFARFGGLLEGFPTALAPETMPTDRSLINSGNFRTNMPFLNSMFVR
ncbi:MAG: hypothetical protein WBZ29_01055 [Methanocella sp.]